MADGAAVKGRVRRAQKGLGGHAARKVLLVRAEGGHGAHRGAGPSGLALQTGATVRVGVRDGTSDDGCVAADLERGHVLEVLLGMDGGCLQGDGEKGELGWVLHCGLICCVGFAVVLLCC